MRLEDINLDNFAEPPFFPVNRGGFFGWLVGWFVIFFLGRGLVVDWYMIDEVSHHDNFPKIGFLWKSEEVLYSFFFLNLSFFLSFSLTGLYMLCCYIVKGGKAVYDGCM